MFPSTPKHLDDRKTSSLPNKFEIKQRFVQLVQIASVSVGMSSECFFFLFFLNHILVVASFSVTDDWKQAKVVSSLFFFFSPSRRNQKRYFTVKLLPGGHLAAAPHVDVVWRQSKQRPPSLSIWLWRCRIKVNVLFNVWWRWCGLCFRWLLSSNIKPS